MGFDKIKALTALLLCNNDVNKAAQWLLDDQNTSLNKMHQVKQIYTHINHSFRI